MCHEVCGGIVGLRLNDQDYLVRVVDVAHSVLQLASMVSGYLVYLG